MATITPFCGVRPRPDLAALMAAPPYDVVDTGEARALAGDNACSFLRVSRPEIDLPPGSDPHAPEAYRQAAATFAGWLASGALVRDPEPAFYLYRIDAGGRCQTGLVCLVETAEYERGAIVRHELTRPDKEDDRTRHLLALSAHTGPVFLLHRARPGIDRLAAAVASGPPAVDFTARDGERQRLWPVGDPAAVAAFTTEFAAVDRLYVADGHHRMAAAARAARVRAAGNPDHTGREGYTRALAVVFPHDQLSILPYNRVVRGLNGLSPDGFLSRVAERFSISDCRSPTPDRPRSFSLFFGGRWRSLEPLEPPDADPVAGLDVSIVQQRLLGPILGIEDPRTDGRIGFVGGIRGTAELERLVREGGADVAFSLHGTTVEQLLAVAEAGLLMPPKSTWFEPKLKDGLVVHAFD